MQPDSSLPDQNSVPQVCKKVDAMNRFVDQDVVGLTDDETTSSVVSFSSHCGGCIVIAPGDVTGSPTTVSWRTALTEDGDTYPVFSIDGSELVTQAFPADANTNGAAIPVPDEVCGAAYLQAVLDTGSCDAVFVKKS